MGTEQTPTATGCLPRPLCQPLGWAPPHQTGPVFPVMYFCFTSFPLMYDSKTSCPIANEYLLALRLSLSWTPGGHFSCFDFTPTHLPSEAAFCSNTHSKARIYLRTVYVPITYHLNQPPEVHCKAHNLLLVQQQPAGTKACWKEGK